MEIYLDNSATTKVTEGVLQAVASAMTENYHNPSALYAPALTAQKGMNACRQAILARVHAPSGARVVLTGGGTESDALFIHGALSSQRGGRVLFSAGEHPAVRENCLALKNVEIEEMPYTREGPCDLEKLRALITPDTRLICCMQVNNETGAVQPLEDIAALRDELAPEALLHVDGVQGFLRVPFDMQRLGVDGYALSGHKIHAPKGVGALVISPRVRLSPIIPGGGQEGGVRSGTENTPGIAGMLAAIEEFPEKNDMREKKLAFWDEVSRRIPEAVVNGPDPASDHAAPHIINFSLPPVRGETMLHALEGDVISVGVGSACSSKKKKTSGVLQAMGVPPKIAGCALRVSLSPYTSMDEVMRTAERVSEHYTLLRRFERR